MKKITIVLIIACAAFTLYACAQEPNDINQPTDEPTQEFQAQGCQRLDLACLDQLTSDTAQDGFPAWSPDGKRIVFSRYGDYVAPEKTGLWLITLETNELEQLTTEIGEHPDWSPDGRSIVFDGEYGDSIQLVSASGGALSRIVPESIQVTQGGQPIWSPDGQHIAFKEGSNLWLLEVSSGRLEKIFGEEGKRPYLRGVDDGLPVAEGLLADDVEGQVIGRLYADDDVDEAQGDEGESGGDGQADGGLLPPPLGFGGRTVLAEGTAVRAALGGVGDFLFALVALDQ